MLPSNGCEVAGFFASVTVATGGTLERLGGALKYVLGDHIDD